MCFEMHVGDTKISLDVCGETDAKRGSGHTDKRAEHLEERQWAPRRNGARFATSSSTMPQCGKRALH